MPRLLSIHYNAAVCSSVSWTLCCINKYITLLILSNFFNPLKKLVKAITCQSKNIKKKNKRKENLARLFYQNGMYSSIWHCKGVWGGYGHEVVSLGPILTRGSKGAFSRMHGGSSGVRGYDHSILYWKGPSYRLHEFGLSWVWLDLSQLMSISTHVSQNIYILVPTCMSSQ